MHLLKLLEMLFPESEIPRAKYDNAAIIEEEENALPWSIALPDLGLINLQQRIKVTSTIMESGSLSFSKNHLAKILRIDRANLSRWQWRRNQQEDNTQKNWWREATIAAVAVHFEAVQTNISERIALITSTFETVNALDVLTWRGNLNLDPSVIQDNYDSLRLLEFLEARGLLAKNTTAESVQATLLSKFKIEIQTAADFYKKVYNLSESTEIIASTLKQAPHPSYIAGRDAFFDYVSSENGVQDTILELEDPANRRATSPFGNHTKQEHITRVSSPLEK